MLEDYTDMFQVDVLKEVDTMTPNLSVKKTWTTIATLDCFADQPKGEAEWFFNQRGYKNPWIFMFDDDPGIEEDYSHNQLRFTDDQGVVRLIEIKNVRNAAQQDWVWIIYGDEITQRPLS